MDTEQKKILHFTYRMRMLYDEPVRKAYFTLKGIPRSNARQKITELSISLSPDSDQRKGTDGFGNRYLYGTVDTEHRSFLYQVEGKAKIGQILYEEPADENLIPVFRHAYGMNRSGETLQYFYKKNAPQLEENDYVNAVFLMHLLHQEFSYKKGMTGVKTTAEEAWRAGGGVCQDYVHIYIALCHMAGIAARYVNGLILGEGESHAWAEILYRGRWIGVDPTNDCLVARSHIKFGHGRDASDCLINKGLLRGGGNQHQEIYVSVKEEGQDE